MLPEEHRFVKTEHLLQQITMFLNYLEILLESSQQQQHKLPQLRRSA
jgi:hypothetical protein